MEVGHERQSEEPEEVPGTATKTPEVPRSFEKTAVRTAMEATKYGILKTSERTTTTGTSPPFRSSDRVLSVSFNPSRLEVVPENAIADPVRARVTPLPIVIFH